MLGVVARRIEKLIMMWVFIDVYLVDVQCTLYTHVPWKDAD